MPDTSAPDREPLLLCEGSTSDDVHEWSIRATAQQLREMRDSLNVTLLQYGESDNGRPPINERVRTDAGWHGRVKGANGEGVWFTEVLEDPRTVSAAYAVLARASTVGVTDVDER